MMLEQFHVFSSKGTSVPLRVCKILSLSALIALSSTDCCNKGCPLRALSEIFALLLILRVASIDVSIEARMSLRLDS